MSCQIPTESLTVPEATSNIATNTNAMKQPNLGKKLAQIRKQENLTQEELVERCNVSVRTIQRIEAGDVTPRTSTVKIILAALGHDLAEVIEDSEPEQGWLKKHFGIGFDSGKNKDAKAILQTAWIAGTIYFVLGLIDAGMDYMNFSGKLDLSQSIFFAVTKASVFLSYALFFRGFVVLGQLFDNYLLKVSSYMIVAAFLVITGIDIFDVFRPFQDDMYLFIQAGASITVGAIGIILGVAFWKLQDGMGRLAAIAGVFEIMVGVCFLTVILFFLSLIMLVPATIVEIVLLFKAYELVSNEQALSKTGKE